MVWRSSSLIAVAIALSACTTTGGFGPSSAKVDLLAGLEGGVVGGPIGTGLDKTERAEALQAELTALETPPGQPAVTWGNVATGRFGEARAGLPYRVGSQDCRPVTQTVMLDGVPQTATGAACRDDLGRWIKVG